MANDIYKDHISQQKINSNRKVQDCVSISTCQQFSVSVNSLLKLKFYNSYKSAKLLLYTKITPKPEEIL